MAEMVVNRLRSNLDSLAINGSLGYVRYLHADARRHRRGGAPDSTALAERRPETIGGGSVCHAKLNGFHELQSSE